tara:strand:- start:4677 stop:5390 length:714 start_codon:yes stop_codon:yes gene_type:complete
MIKSGGNNMCLAILVILALFLMYQLLCKNNKTVGGDGHEKVEDTTNVVDNSQNMNVDVIESDTPLDTESESELNFNDPDYANYEPVIDNNNQEVPVADMQDNNMEVLPERTPEETVNTVEDKYNITGLEDSDAYFMLNTNEVGPSATQQNNKLNPSELLPADSKNMEGNNFLTASLSKNEQIIGIPTQTQRSRKNYDLRSAPPNPQVEVSPWNMSTMEPDTGRLTFEIGQSHCPPCE